MMRSKSIYVIAFLVFLLGHFTNPMAQDGRLLRVELEVRPNTYPFTLIPLDDKGLLLAYEIVNEESGRESAWVLQYYDNGLNPGWKREERIPPRHKLLSWILEGGKVSLMFGREEADGEEPGVIVTVDPESGSAIYTEFFVPDKDEAYYLDMEGAWFVIASCNRKYQSTLHILNKDSGQKQLALEVEDETWVEDVYWDPGAQRLYVLVKYRGSRKDHGMKLLTYLGDGSRESVMTLPRENNRWLSAGDIVPSASGGVLLLGTYSRDETVRAFNSASPVYETGSGFFTARIDSAGQMAVNYYPFSGFNNYFSHLSSGDVARMRTGKEGVVAPGIDFNLILHPVSLAAGKFILVAESYYEKYHYVSRMAYDFYGRPTPTSYTVFDGYQFTNAFLAGFDGEGSLNWDNNFEIRNMLMNERRRLVNVLPDGSDVILVYMDDGKIASQAVSGNDIVAPFSLSPVAASRASERITEGERERIVHWYDGYALAFGYQRVRSLSSASGDRRFVFYFSKIAYH